MSYDERGSTEFDRKVARFPNGLLQCPLGQEQPLLTQQFLLDSETVLEAGGEWESDEGGAGSPIWKSQRDPPRPAWPPPPSAPPPLKDQHPRLPPNDGLAHVVRILKRVERSTRAISEGLAWEERYEEIQREWGQLARVVERLLMIVFVVGTALFALLVTVLAVPVPIVSYWSN